jgi:hypothetical protein
MNNIAYKNRLRFVLKLYASVCEYKVLLYTIYINNSANKKLPLVGVKIYFRVGYNRGIGVFQVKNYKMNTI